MKNGPIEVLLVCWLLAGMIAGPLQALMPMAFAAMQSGGTLPTTQLTDTVYRADGTTATGTVLVSWPAFTTANGLAVPAGNTSVTIATGGVLTLALVPNAGSNPMGSYYTAVYHLDDGTVSREYWVVPVSASPVTISSIKSTVLPASVALQTVTKSYVDTAIQAAVSPSGTAGTYVLKAGDTMTGPLVLPADPVSANQAADKHYVDTSVAAVSAGSGESVSLEPSANQVITQPTGTSLSVNRLNGVEYASQYTTLGQLNGVANATTSTDCASGCEVKADPSYVSTEVLRPLQWNSQTHVEDTRLGGRWDSYINPENIQTPGLESGQGIDVVSTRSGAVVHQLYRTDNPASIGLAISNEAPTGGSNLYPKTIDGTVPYYKSGYSAMTVNGTYNTQGQHVLVPRGTNCFGVGDCLIGSEYITSSGGFRDEADEGTHPMDIQVTEDTRVFDGTCTSGCSTGSTLVNITATAGAGTQGDGRFLIDMNPAKVLTTGTLIGGSLGTPHANATFAGTSFPLSTFFATAQAIVSQTSDVAPGMVTFAIATTGAPSGYATNTSAAPASTGIACIADEPNGYLPANYETAAYTVIDGTHFQMTLKKAHAALASVAIGGLCGYGLEQTVDTANGIRQVFPVVGSYSATGLYYAGTTSAVVAQQGSTSAYVNVNQPIATLSRSGNVVTVTTTGNMPFDLNGLAVTISGVADSSYDGTFIATTTGLTTLTYAQEGSNSTSSGGALTLLTGGFALYPMAEVLSVFDATAKSVDGQMTLAPNNVAWSVNDAVEEPHFYQQIVDTDISYVTQTMPRPTTYARAGVTYQGNNGPGLQGWSVNNTTPAASYVGNGGTHSAPDFAYQSTGVWKRTMSLQAGEQSVFTINCNSHGCGRWNSPYNLFELQSSAGTDTVQWQPGSSTLNFYLRGTQYSFSPSGLTAGTVNATTVNATTLNGALSAANLTSGTVPTARLSLFGASGTNHAAGIVPDPGTTAGTTRYLREDGTWSTPTGTGGSGGGGGGSVAAITSGTIDGTVIGGTTPAAGSFTTLTASTPIAATSGGTGSGTAPAAGQVLVGNAGGTAFAPQTVSGDCTLLASGAVTCTKTNGTTFGSAATTSATAYDAAGAAAAVASAGLQKANNLSDLASAATARTNLGLGTAATTAATAYDAAGAAAAVQSAGLQKANNLSDVASAATARTNLGLGAAATHGASISINGTACSLDGSCTAFSYATLPQQANVIADYQLSDGSGTAPADSSGNGNTGSFPTGTAAPTWTSQGLSCNGVAGTTTGQYFTTAGTQNAKSIMMVYTIASPLGSNSPSYPYFYTLWSTPSLSGLGLYSGSQTYGYQPMLAVNGAQQSTMDGSMVGTHVLIAVLGVSGGSPTTDTYYLDGIQQPTISNGQSFGKANGVYDVCGAPTGYATYMTGSVYRWTAWSTQLSAQDAAAASGLTKTLAQSKGVVFTPVYSPTTTPQAIFTGDSLTNGEGVTPFENFLATNITYNIVNYGIGNITAQQNMSLLPTREKPSYAPNAKSNISFLWNGTNDIATHGRTAQQAVDAILQECSLMHSFGFKTIAATTISRGSGNDSATKNPINLLLRAQALNACDVLADFAGNPLVGADGANTNTTYYQSDNVHLTQAGQQNVIAPIASHAIDQATGSTLTNCDPNVVTSATYTSVAADGCKVFNTASNAITDTLPSAVGYTNRVIRRCNSSSSGTNALTIAAPSDTPFNNVTGTTAIMVPNNTCKDFKGTLISPTTAGEYWQQLN
jgi:hypothetical protein